MTSGQLKMTEKRKKRKGEKKLEHCSTQLKKTKQKNNEQFLWKKCINCNKRKTEHLFELCGL